MASLRWCVAALSIAVSPAWGVAADSGTLVVRATGFASEQGDVLIQVANSREDYESDDEGFRTAKVATRAGRTEHRFEGLPYGEYAVKIFHDENSNLELDIGWMGPEERYGFSNGVRGLMGPPDWDEAKFRFEDAEQTVRIEVK